MKHLDVCTTCGATADDHHTFTSVLVPDACQCDPMDWGTAKKVPEICSTFVPMSEREPELCLTCEHEAVCHEARK